MLVTYAIRPLKRKRAELEEDALVAVTSLPPEVAGKP